MTFTEFGLAQIKKPNFVQIYRGIPQDDYFALVFLALVGCAVEETGELGGSCDAEIEEFVDSHEKELLVMQREIQKRIRAAGMKFRLKWSDKI